MIDMSGWPTHLRERQEANMLDALLIVAARQVAHMRAPDDATTTVDAPVLPKE